MISAQKVRLVADAIRGKKIDEAQAILSFTVKKASLPVLKLLNSAVANVKGKTEEHGRYLCPDYIEWKQN